MVRSKKIHPEFIPISRPFISIDGKKEVREVLESGNLAMGERVERFEKAFARFCKVKYAVAVSSGTAALTLALQGALDTDLLRRPRRSMQPEVITTPFTFVATVNSILAAGGRPVYVDIDPGSYNIDPTLVEKAITSRTKAIIPIHLYGQPAEMRPLLKLAKENNISMIEDACQAHGAMYKGKMAGNINGSPGTLSSSGCFSFYPTKNMTTAEGGMVTTNDAELAENIRQFRNHGMPTDPKKRYVYISTGLNQRMTEISGAIGLHQLKGLLGRNRLRIRNAKEYDEALERIEGIILPSKRTGKGNKHVFHQYTIRVIDPKDRPRLISHLRKKGIDSKIYYPDPLDLNPSLGKPAKRPKKNSLEASRTVLSIPIHPGLTRSQRTRVIKGIRTYFTKRRRT